MRAGSALGRMLWLLLDPWRTRDSPAVPGPTARTRELAPDLQLVASTFGGDRCVTGDPWERRVTRSAEGPAGRPPNAAGETGRSSARVQVRSTPAVARAPAVGGWDLLLVCVAACVATGVGRVHEIFPVLLPLKP